MAYSRNVIEYNRLSDRPPAADFGIGYCQIGLDFYKSDGITWVTYSPIAKVGSLADIPAGASGVYQVGTQLYVGDGVKKRVLSEQFRAAVGTNTYGDGSVADKLLADDKLWHLIFFGDSRLTGAGIDIVSNAPTGIPLGGISLPSNALSPTGVTTSHLLNAAGDQRINSPYIGSPWTSSLDALEFKTSAGTTGWNNTLTNRLSYPSADFSTMPKLLARLSGVNAQIGCIVRTDSSGLPTYPSLVAGDSLVIGLQYIIATPGTTVFTGIGAANNNAGTIFTSTATSFTGTGSCSTVAGFQLQYRPNNSTAQTSLDYQISSFVPSYSPTVNYHKHTLDIPSTTTTWGLSGANAPDIGMTISQNTPLLANQILGMHDIWVETPTGICIHNGNSVSGRSLAGVLSPMVTPQETHDKINPLYGENIAVVIALGTNGNPFGGSSLAVGVTPTYFINQTKSDLKSLIGRIRSGKPNCPIILLNDYATSGDVSAVAAGTSNKYWQAMIDIANLNIPGVLCIDTYNAMPSYTVGNGLGYYADATHYNATGRAAWLTKFWSLLQSA